MRIAAGNAQDTISGTGREKLQERQGMEMESPVERLQRIWEHKEPKRKLICGMCPSCRQRKVCPGGSDGLKCNNYLPPEPTKSEWADIYREAFRRTFENSDATTKVNAIGHAKAIRDAMLQIHGFDEKEIRDIERETEDDMHPVPGRRDVLPG